jgi:SHS2 domain-containing protein
LPQFEQVSLRLTLSSTLVFSPQKAQFMILYPPYVSNDVLTIQVPIDSIFIVDNDKLDFSVLDHTADLRIRIRGKDLRDLFEKAAKSMTHVMVKGVSPENADTLELSVPGTDVSDLMVRWLGEILYLFEGEHQVVTAVKINTISPTYLDATLKTVPFDLNLHEVLCEVKAVTYHQIEVVQEDDRWETRVTLDL